MKRVLNIAAECVVVIVFIGYVTAMTAAAQTSAPKAPEATKAVLPCSGGTWTPTPVAQAQSGGASTPAFHTIYGLSCGGNVYMVRFGNKISGENIKVDMLGKTPVACSGGNGLLRPFSKRSLEML
jgi:hypothetical protein